MKYTSYISPSSGEMKQQNGYFVPDSEHRENDLIKLYPDQIDQTWEGFGGAVTDSCAYVWSLMPQELQDIIINAFFTNDGLNYNLVRVTIDSCDFSLEQYEAAPDGNPAHFDMTRPLRYVLPMLEAIRKVRPNITLMLSPWSPPAIFKTNGQRHGGGKCKKEHLDDWAEYICQYIKEFEDRGFIVSRISLQNEPHAVQTWDSCIWSSEEERDFLVKHMKPALERHGYGRIEVYVWDHNKERILDRALTIMNKEGLQRADGVAFHWYSGDHFDALRQVHLLFPDKKLLLSESCIEYYKFSVADPILARTVIAHEIMGDLESGTSAFLDWNLMLDEQGGPNYASNFSHAPYLYDTKTGELKRQSLYDALWHFAHFITPDSKRILSSCFTSDIEKTAFLREDGKIALVLHNRGRCRKIYILLGRELAALTLPAKSLTTVLIEWKT